MNKTGKVSAVSGLHLREHPDANSRILFKLQNGALVKIDGENGNWWQVVTAWGECGYLYKKHVQVIPTGPVDENPEFRPALPPPLISWHRTWAETFVTAMAIGLVAFLLIWMFGLSQ